MGRNGSRSTFDDHTRLVLVEQDADEFEATVASMRTLLIGMLVSLATASIMLAFNLITQK